MADWNMVAVIVAVIAIPLTSSLLLAILERVREDVVRKLYQRSKCDAIEWQNLSDKPIPRIPPRTAAYNYNASSNERILVFFKHVWGAKMQLVDRPRYLEPQVQYLRINAEALIVGLMLDPGAEPISAPAKESSLTSGGWGSFAIREGSVEGTFEFRRDEATSNNCAYVIGSLRGFSLGGLQDRFWGMTKDDLRSIAGGYPPFYRKTFKANSNVDVPHPILEPRDASRAGWVVAIGFGSDNPTTLYNANKSQDYEEACARVLHVLRGVLTTEFSTHQAFGPMLRATAEGVKKMNDNKTGSVISNADFDIFGITGSPGQDLGVAQIKLILNLFNNYGKKVLTSDEHDELEKSLPEVLKASLQGVCTWWQYINNTGRAIPDWLLDNRVQLSPIWLKDSGRDL
ncbi:hypothetical protein TWF718_000001 [Orbilia javanica]|uniref:Uncharacterized protein n=1 Tax=Orbilia javanica TaxID=47235 RepID=A0AAN8RR73_9PEZI